MNFITAECNGNPLGIRTSQLVTRNCTNFGNNKHSLESETDNINRFLAAHSRKNESQKWKKHHRYDDKYVVKDIQSKSSSAHQFLCGPLNTNRLSRKFHSYTFDGLPSTPRFSNFHHLYGNQKEICKTPWNNVPPNSTNFQTLSHQNECKETFNEPLPTNTPIICDNTTAKSTDSGISDTAFNFSPSLVQNLAPYLKEAENVRISVKKRVLSIPAPHQNILDSQVPNPVYVDGQNSCPLYDSSEYEQINDLTEEQNKPSMSQLSEVQSPEPSHSRYRFYIGEELPNFIFNDNKSTDIHESAKNYNLMKNVNFHRTKPKAREDVLIPLLTSPDGEDIFITEYKPIK